MGEKLFPVARDRGKAEEAEDESGAAGLDLSDPNIGALTQIFREFAPPGTPMMIEQVEVAIDEIVKEGRCAVWASTQKADRVGRKEVRSGQKEVRAALGAGLVQRRTAHRGTQLRGTGRW